MPRPFDQLALAKAEGSYAIEELVVSEIDILDGLAASRWRLTSSAQQRECPDRALAQHLFELPRRLRRALLQPPDGGARGAAHRQPISDPALRAACASHAVGQPSAAIGRAVRIGTAHGYRGAGRGRCALDLGAAGPIWGVAVGIGAAVAIGRGASGAGGALDDLAAM